MTPSSPSKQTRDKVTSKQRERSSEPRAYLRPSWIDRRVIAGVPGAARLMSRLTGDSLLQVRGRLSGRMRTTLVRTLDVGGKRYVVGIRGETQWARNLRAAGEALLRAKGKVTQVRATEALGSERRAVVEAFIATSKYAPTRRMLSEILPRPEQHPVFRIEPLASSSETS